MAIPSYAYEKSTKGDLYLNFYYQFYPAICWRITRPNGICFNSLFTIPFLIRKVSCFLYIWKATPVTDHRCLSVAMVTAMSQWWLISPLFSTKVILVFLQIQENEIHERSDTIAAKNIDFFTMWLVPCVLFHVVMYAMWTNSI